jgi:hypothetical protein
MISIVLSVGSSKRGRERVIRYTTRSSGFLCAGIVLAIVLSSCATVPYVQKEDRIYKLIDLINRGEVTKVPDLLMTPFLVDGEIVLLQKDLLDFWNNMHNAGFEIRNPRIRQNRFAVPEDARMFRDSMEVRTFFKKYIDTNTSLVEIESADGTYYFLLNRLVKGYPRIQGFRGPVQ